MEFLAGPWNKDWASFLQFWLTVILSLQMQFSPVATCPDECRCDKLFVYCNERSLTSVPLGIEEGFKVLYLHNNQINSAGFPMELHNLASVETVYLYGNQLDEFPINLPKNTKILHLQENNIQTISKAALAQLTKLEELHLDDNSISTVGVEEGAFREALSLKLLFLTKNHLSSVPIGLPEDLKELRLDENRIAIIAEEAFQNVTRLQRLLLDGNLLTDEGIAPGTFQDLANLRELALARNSLTFPLLLPSQALVKLNLQENQINQIPVAAFADLNRLEKLDVSGNQLQTLTQGVFDGLSSLRHLIVRNNPWHCDCAVKWVVVWLKSLPTAINARGFVCLSPDKVRGMAIRELTLDIIECPVEADQPPWPTLRSTPPPPPTTTPITTMISNVITTSVPYYFDSPSPPLPPIHINPPGPLPPYEDPLQISFNVVNATNIEVSWDSYFTVTGYKVTWVKRGQTQINEGMREQTVSGGRRHISLLDLEPRSVYRICVHVLDTLNSYRPGEDTICSEARTKPALSSKIPGRDQAPQESINSTLLMAGIIGGAVLIILVTLLSLFCWHMHRKSRSASTKWKYNRGRRKDDYCEAGTKKDNSILEMTETSFQIVALNNEQLLKGDFRIQPIYTPNGGIGFRECHLSNNSIVYCKSSNVPSTEFCQT